MCDDLLMSRLSDSLSGAARGLFFGGIGLLSGAIGLFFAGDTGTGVILLVLMVVFAVAAFSLRRAAARQKSQPGEPGS
jgi:hypothetical protein